PVAIRRWPRLQPDGHRRTVSVRPLGGAFAPPGWDCPRRAACTARHRQGTTPDLRNWRIEYRKPCRHGGGELGKWLHPLLENCTVCQKSVNYACKPRLWVSGPFGFVALRMVCRFLDSG